MTKSTKSTEKQGSFLELFEKQKNIILGIIVMTSGFFYWVVIPLSEIKVQLVAIQTSVSDTAMKQNEQLRINQEVRDRIGRIEGEIKNLQTK